MDVMVVLMHWGREYYPRMNDVQRQAAQHLTSLGVHLVIGTHPHVIQPYSYHGNRFVAYSLGNLLFVHAMTPEKFRVSKHSVIAAMLASCADLFWTHNALFFSHIRAQRASVYMRGGYCARMTIHPGTSVLVNALEMCPLYFRQSSITEKHDKIRNREYGF